MDEKEGKSGYLAVVAAVITGFFLLASILLKDHLDSRRIAASPTETPATTAVFNMKTSSQSKAPLSINGKQYFLPSDLNKRCIAMGQTGMTNGGVEYRLTVPDGWYIVWDSWKAYWPSGSYENDGLLGIYGPWEGKVTVVNGELCAVPAEWSQYATDLRRGATKPQSTRPEYYLNQP